MRDDLAGDDLVGDDDAHRAGDAPGDGTAGAAGAGEDAVRLTAWVHGDVQGVGFRWATRVRALELGLVGYARNYADGRVLVTAEGPGEAVESLRAWLRSAGTPGTVTTVVDSLSEARGGYSGFDRR